LVRPRRARLKHAAIHLISILKLDAMMTLYQSLGLIDDEQYQRYLATSKPTAPRRSPARTSASLYPLIIPSSGV